MLEIFKREKGTVRRGAVEAVRAYAVLRHKFPNDTESQIAERMWQGWRCINESIDADTQRDLRLARLLDVKARREGYTGDEDVIDIYFDILYIETGMDSLSKRSKIGLDAFFDLLEQNGMALSGTRRDYHKRLKELKKAAKVKK